MPAIAKTLHQRVTEHGVNPDDALELILTVFETEAWRKVNKQWTFFDFIETPVQKKGVGWKWEELADLVNRQRHSLDNDQHKDMQSRFAKLRIAVAKGQAKSQTKTKTQGGNNNPEGIGGKSGKSIVKGNNVSIDNKRESHGNNANAILRRIAKRAENVPKADGSERYSEDEQKKATRILNDFETGKIKSAYAAGVEAGITRKQITVPADDADLAVGRLLKHYTKQKLQNAIKKA